MQSAWAQTSKDLAEKYGPPKSEQYEIAQGVELRVCYGQDHMICQLVLVPRPAREGDTDRQPGYIDTRLSDRILNEFVPPQSRQGKALKTLTQSGCSAVRRQIHDNVYIGIVTNECRAQPADKISSLLIPKSGAFRHLQRPPNTILTGFGSIS